MRASEEIRKELVDEDELQLEKKDSAAMMIAGLLTIGLPCLLLVLMIVGVTVLLFGI